MRSRRLRYGTRTPPIVRTTRRGYALAKVTRHATARMPTRGSSPMIVIGFRAISSASTSAAALYGGANGQACNDYRVHVMLSVGVRLGPYEIVAPLGAGGMGEVYRARDTRLDRTVAIKVLPSQLAADAQLRERFDREARAISSLQHPHVCALFDVGEAVVSPQSSAGSAETIQFLVLEYLEGETLAGRLARAGALPIAEALTIAIDLCDALDKAHRSGIVHRDLKPANVMLTKSGAKLLDFGLARTAAPAVTTSSLSMALTTPPNVTAQGTILGTFQYMAPEQIEGLEADARTDIFAFGVLLFEMLTGRTAFEGITRASLTG